MTTNYDPIAEQYKRSKQQPWRTFIECFTLMEVIGDPRGMTVLDVACGEGFYTRLLRQRGAARLTGVDLSQGMIDLARCQEAQHELGIEYVVGDARELSSTNEYDLVVAAYLLNYARNRDELQVMCDGSRAVLPAVRVRDDRGGRLARGGTHQVDVLLERRPFRHRKLLPRC